jgi:hypothetical protein
MNIEQFNLIFTREGKWALESAVAFEPREKDFLGEFNFEILSLTENIGHRAAIYIEEYSLSSGLRARERITACFQLGLIS